MNVATASPPIWAWQRGFQSGPPSSARGNKARIVAPTVIITGRMRSIPASGRARSSGSPFSCISSMKSNSTMTWLTMTPIRLASPRNPAPPSLQFICRGQGHIVRQPDVEVKPILDVFGKELLLQVRSRESSDQQEKKGTGQHQPPVLNSPTHQ